MAGRTPPQDNSGAAARGGKSKLRGWLVILAVALGTAVFFFAGTIDPSVRYDWIGL